MEKRKMINYNILSCPNCLEINSDKCNIPRCKKECLSVCPTNAINLASGRIDMNKCDGCLDCIFACPLNAIDKFSLVKKEEYLICLNCLRKYQIKNGIFYAYYSKNEDKEYLNYYEEDYQKNVPSNFARDVGLEIKTKYILKVISPSNQFFDTYLDIGCGKGYIMKGLSNKLNLKQIWGLELSRFELTRAQSEMPSAFFVWGNAEYLPFKNSKINLITLIDVLEHIPSVNKVLKEIARITEYLVIKVPLEDTIEQHILNYSGLFLKAKKVNHNFKEHINQFNKQKVLSVLNETGYEIIKYKITDTPFRKYYYDIRFFGITSSTSLKNKIYFYIRRMIIVSLRRLIFIFLNPLYHKICPTGLYVFCRSKKWKISN